MLAVPFVDLHEQYLTLKPEILKAIEDVLDSSHFILGPHVSAFETSFAAAHGQSFGIATNNGTSALHLALWSYGVTHGDEVIVPVNTFIATAEAAVLCGAKPVFVDHDEYLNLDPTKIEKAITQKTKAIIAVHLYGQPARMEEIKLIAQKHNLILIEDAAQAHFASFASKPIGSWGHATCFSFYPGKNLGAYGEAGAVITSDATAAEKMKVLRDHGSFKKYNHLVSGHNYRMEALQGAILNVKMKYIRDWTTKRRQHAQLYGELLKHCPTVQIPNEHAQAESVWHLYVVRVPEREALQAFLQLRNISTGLHYPVPLHKQQAFADLGYAAGAFPEAEKSANEILSLPMYPELTREQITWVTESIKEFYDKD